MDIEIKRGEKLDITLQDAFKNQIPVNIVIGIDTSEIFIYMVRSCHSDVETDYNTYELLLVK